MKSKKKILLDIKKLSVSIAENSKNKKLLKSISFNIKKNEIVGIIGESGSGKSLTALCILGLLEKKNFNISGEIFFNQINIVNLQENEIVKIRGSEISMIFQEPMTALNPTMKIGEQLFEIFRSDKKIDSKKISSRIEKLIKKVRLDNVENLFDKYPHQLSGGQKQRVMIVMALCCNPKLLIADEPTTA